MSRRVARWTRVPRPLLLYVNEADFFWNKHRRWMAGRRFLALLSHSLRAAVRSPEPLVRWLWRSSGANRGLWTRFRVFVQVRRHFFCVGELPDVFSSWLVNWYDIFVSLRGFRQNHFSYRCITTDFFFFFLLVSRHFESHVQVCESPKAPKDSRIRNLGRRVKRASHLPRPFVVLNKPV